MREGSNRTKERRINKGGEEEEKEEKRKGEEEKGEKRRKERRGEETLKGRVTHGFWLSLSMS